MLNMTRKRGGVRATLPLVPNTRAGCRSSRRGAAQAGDRLRLVAWPDNDELSMDNMIGTISFILARFDDATRRLPFRSPRALRFRLYLYPLGELEDIEISVDIGYSTECGKLYSTLGKVIQIYSQRQFGKPCIPGYS